MIALTPGAPARPSAPPRGGTTTTATPDPTADDDTVSGPMTDQLLAKALLAAERAQAELDDRRMAFDQMLRARAEIERENNSLRDLAVEQAKRDDEYLKKCISMI
jgi:hypothetical protein